MKNSKKIFLTVGIVGVLAFTSVGIGLAALMREGGVSNHCDTDDCNPPNYCTYCEFAQAGILLPSPADREEMFFRLGQLERTRVGLTQSRRTTDSVHARGNGFVVYSDEVDLAEERLMVMGSVNAREQAVDVLLRHEVLYATAREHGFYATDREVRAFISESIEFTRNSMNFETDIVPLLRGAEMSLEEYWESRSDIIRQELVISKYHEWLRMSFIVERGYDDNSETIQDVIEDFSFEASDEISEMFRSADMVESEWSDYFEEVLDELLNSVEFAR
jgi:hypothetical protein